MTQPYNLLLSHLAFGLFLHLLMSAEGASHAAESATSLPSTRPTAPSATLPTTAPTKTLTQILREWGTQCDHLLVDQFPDYSFFMRAKITAEQWCQLQEMLRADGWTRVEEEEVSDMWTWFELEERPEWWCPTKRVLGSYTFSEKGRQGALKYEDGFVFYYVIKS